ncbi:MAG: calcium-binding protein [Hyphomicrobium sp.]
MADSVLSSIATTATLDLAGIGNGLFGTFSSRIDTVGDHDWIRVDLTAGTTYFFYLSMDTIGAGSGDSEIVLRDAAGIIIPGTGDDDGGAGLNSFIAFTPGATGTFFVDAFEHSISDRGAFNLVVTTFGQTDIFLTDGDDSQTGLAGQRLLGGAGDDTLTVGAGRDAFGEQGDDDITGSTGNDLLSGGLGNDSIFGGDGIDFIFGDTGDDLLDGEVGGDQIKGGDGSDLLRGGIGFDTLNGGADDDILDGGTDADDMTGGTGDDFYRVDDLSDVVREALGAANGTQDFIESTVTVNLATTTTAQGIEHIRLVGGAVSNAFGHSTFNTIVGNSAANYIAAGGGNDTAAGGNGNDRLQGDAGKDTLSGGLNDDSFLYAFIADSGGTQPRRDVITDFSQIAGNNDWIDLSAADANGAVAGNQAFTFIGTAAFTGVAGQLRYFQDVANNRTIIEGNVRVDAASPGAEFSIELTGLKTLTGGVNNTFDIIL